MSKIITTRKGQICGLEEDGYEMYLGIPYAKPPVGDLRWKKPEPCDAWEDVYEATHFQAMPMQLQRPPFYEKEFPNIGKYKTEASEDCLYLNVWIPKGYEGEKLPVAIYIYGGAFAHGYAHNVSFDGEYLCKKGVIIVTFNYRVNLFGFLSHPWLQEEGNVGNFGIYDQVEAVKWVHENIEAFGGDKENITLFGQSAGGMSVQILASIPQTQNLISKAIIQSAGGYRGGLDSTTTLEEGFKKGIKLQEFCGVSSLQEWRDIPTEQLAQLTQAYINKVKQEEGIWAGVRTFTPVIGDETLLMVDSNTIIDQGKIAKIPYMIGSTKDDITATKEDIEKGIHSPLYEGCIAFAHKLEELQGGPTYVYYFSHDLPGDDAGAFHSGELWYTFGTIENSWRPIEEEDKVLAEEMMNNWVSFFKYSHPCEDWKPCTIEEEFVKEFQ